MILSAFNENREPDNVVKNPEQASQKDTSSDNKNKLITKIHIIDLEHEEEFLTNGRIDSSKKEYIDFKKT